MSPDVSIGYGAMANVGMGFLPSCVERIGVHDAMLSHKPL